MFAMDNVLFSAFFFFFFLICFSVPPAFRCARSTAQLFIAFAVKHISNLDFLYNEHELILTQYTMGHETRRTISLLSVGRSVGVSASVFVCDVHGIDKKL